MISTRRAAETRHRTAAPRPRFAAGAVTVSAAMVLAVLALAACGRTPATAANTVTLVTHDSFAVSAEVLAAFEKQSGYTVEQVAPGDAGSLVNQLILTKDAPLGDAVFGIDNTFASRAISAGVVQPYQAKMSASAAQYALGTNGLTPIDVGDVCVNVDHTWFTAHGVAEPVTFDDLTKPAYQNLLVVQNPATSSPGLAFLLATIAARGDDWRAYWKDLDANGMLVADGWSDAYNVDFSAGQGRGTRPLVVSYSSSPANTLTGDGTQSTTGTLDQTCFRQVEYAGVLTGAKNPAGARALIDFLSSAAFQADIPGSMYMYPVDDQVPIPEGWSKFAPLSAQPWTLDPQDIAKNRDTWIKQWTATVLG